MLKKSMLILFIITAIPVLPDTSTNNSNQDIDPYIAEKWEMVTNAGFGYNLVFDNENRTFKMYYFSECTFPVRDVLKGKFKISVVKGQYLITLVFNDFSVDYVLKYSSRSECISEQDKLTDAEMKYMIDCDKNRYPLNYALIFKEVKVTNKRDKWPQYYDDLRTHSFVYAEKPDSDRDSE